MNNALKGIGKRIFPEKAIRKTMIIEKKVPDLSMKPK